MKFKLASKVVGIETTGPALNVAVEPAKSGAREGIRRCRYRAGRHWAPSVYGWTGAGRGGRQTAIRAGAW